jgi:hypothetical protein
MTPGVCSLFEGTVEPLLHLLCFRELPQKERARAELEDDLARHTQELARQWAALAYLNKETPAYVEQQRMVQR